MQFREIEFALGYKRASTVNYLKPDFPGDQRMNQRLHERTVVDHFYDFLGTRGAQIPTELKNRDVTQPNGPDERVQEEILRLYRNSPECSILFELMTDFDEGLQEWRYRHVKLVECTIGAKKGSRRIAGCPVLKRNRYSDRSFTISGQSGTHCDLRHSERSRGSPLQIFSSVTGSFDSDSLRSG